MNLKATPILKCLILIFTLATLSALYLETGQFDKSISSARQALDILPWKLTPRFTLASAQLKKGNKKEAFTYCLDTILTPEKRRTRNGMKLKQQARELLPLCIPEDIFMNYLLPYAQLEEKRDNWRKEFLILCTPMVNECKSAGEVVLSLQSWLPLQLLFTFDHEGRSRSNWSVGEIIENRTANCIGLSILQWRMPAVPLEFLPG